MKMILAIVNNDDGPVVSSQLTKGGYQVTKLATTGGFLMSGNTTFLIGVDEEKVEDVIQLIAQYSRKRKQVVPASTGYMGNMFTTQSVEVNVGGATIFVLGVERFDKV